MPYNNVISRTDAAALIPEEYSAMILQGAVEQSAALRLFRNVPMSRAQQRMPVMSALPTAYFVNGDTGLKQTTEVAWANKYLNVEEIAAIVPIPEAVLDDTGFDVWGTMQPLLVEAVGRALDNAIFFGVDKPATWPDAIATAAVAAGNTATRGTNAAGAGGYIADIEGALAALEADGYDLTGVLANRSVRARLRSARNTQGDRYEGVTTTAFEDAPIVYPMRGLWPTGLNAVEAILGDFSQGMVGIRQDVTYKILDQAPITDNTGAIIYNLAQQDMIALRVVARYAFQVANPINRDQATEASRYPFSVVRSPAA